MIICIRADASMQIGSGHIMRCLTLAGELRSNGAEVFFISRLLEGHLCDICERAGFKVFMLPLDNIPDVPPRADKSPRFSPDGAAWMIDAEESRAVLTASGIRPDWLIVDSYSLDVHWEKRLRPLVGKIMVLDDIANRPHDCDLLLDQNLHESMEIRYDGLLPDHCRKLLGPRFTLLRPEFMEEHRNLRKRNGNVRRILVFFGGSDSSNETIKALEALRLINRPDIFIDVVVGSSNPHNKQVFQFCTGMSNAAYHCNIDTIARLMAAADLSIGAGGSTMWERCFLGLPAITLVLAGNQTEATYAVANRNAIWNLGWHENVTVSLLMAAILRALDNPQQLVAMGKNALSLMGGKLSESSSSIAELMLGGEHVKTR